jgi:hypothetical protein
MESRWTTAGFSPYLRSSTRTRSLCNPPCLARLIWLLLVSFCRHILIRTHQTTPSPFEQRKPCPPRISWPLTWVNFKHRFMTFIDMILKRYFLFYSILFLVISYLQRDHYEGSQFDLTQGIAAGPYGDPNRFDMSPQPQDVLGLLWFSQYAPSSSSYVPFYISTKSLPKSFTRSVTFIII